MLDDVTANDDSGSNPVDDGITTPLPKKDSPFSPPTDIPKTEHDELDDTHPATDTNVQVEEEYDEGLAGAAEASEPNIHNAVEGYDPKKDQRKQTEP